MESFFYNLPSLEEIFSSDVWLIGYCVIIRFFYGFKCVVTATGENIVYMTLVVCYDDVQWIRWFTDVQGSTLICPKFSFSSNLLAFLSNLPILFIATVSAHHGIPQSKNKLPQPNTALNVETLKENNCKWPGHKNHHKKKIRKLNLCCLDFS